MRFKGNKSHSRIPKDSRRIPIFGDPVRGNGEDHGKWYRCWNCGFICNSDRDALGDSQSRDGRVLTDYAQQLDLSAIKPQAMLGGISVVHSVAEYGADETAKGVRNAIMVSSSASSGCPLCGSLNYRGDY